MFDNLLSNHFSLFDGIRFLICVSFYHKETLTCYFVNVGEWTNKYIVIGIFKVEIINSETIVSNNLMNFCNLPLF